MPQVRPWSESMAKTITTEEMQANNEPTRIVDSNHLRDGANLNGNGAGNAVSAAPVRYASEKQLALI